MFPAAPTVNDRHVEGGQAYFWDGLWERGHPPNEIDAGGKIGEVKMWPQETAPAHFLTCDGQAFDQVTYPDLFAVLGKATLPNIANRFIKYDRGAVGQMLSPIAGAPRGGVLTTAVRGISSSDGDHNHIAANRSHQTGWTDSSSALYAKSEADAPSGSMDNVGGGGLVTGYQADHTHTVVITGVVSGGDAEMRPPNIATNFIIRASNP